MQRRHFIAGGGVAGLGVLGFAAQRLMVRGETDVTKATEALGAGPEAEAAEAAVGPAIQDMILGTPGQGVEIIEYASFTCPHCAHFHAESMPLVKSELIETGAAHFIFREVYFDRPGLWASMLARKAGPARFFGMSDMFYDRQRDWARGSSEEIAESLRKIARIAGMSDADIDSAMKDEDFAKGLMAWYEANARRDGINATPTLFVAGEKLGPVGYDVIAKAVEAAA